MAQELKDMLMNYLTDEEIVKEYSVKSQKKNIIIGIIFLTVTMFLAACDQNSNPIAHNDEANIDIDYRIDVSNRGESITKALGRRYKAKKEFSFNYNLKSYNGGTIQIHKGSNFHVYDNSFTPPNYTNWGDTVTITMIVDYNEVEKELIFTFGPSGSQFSPAARIKLDYSLIAQGNDVPNLYYIDGSGGYIKQEPYKVNRGKKFMYLYVEHFSRYAVAYGN